MNPVRARAFQTCLPLSKIEKRRDARASPPLKFPDFRPDPAPRPAPETHVHIYISHQNFKSRLTRPEKPAPVPAFSPIRSRAAGAAAGAQEGEPRTVRATWTQAAPAPMIFGPSPELSPEASPGQAQERPRRSSRRSTSAADPGGAGTGPDAATARADDPRRDRRPRPAPIRLQLHPAPEKPTDGPGAA